MLLLTGFLQILSLCGDIFLNIVPLSSSTSELPPHSHFVVVCLFQREINQGLIGKEIVHALLHSCLNKT